MKGIAEAFVDLNKLLKKFKNIDPSMGKCSLIERNVHGSLFAYKQISDEKSKKLSKPLWAYF